MGLETQRQPADQYGARPGRSNDLDPDLRVFSAAGYYDFATPFFATVYTLNHLALAPQLQDHISYGFYESGHMIFLNPQALAQFHDDLERWYAATLAAGLYGSRFEFGVASRSRRASVSR